MCSSLDGLTQCCVRVPACSDATGPGGGASSPLVVMDRVTSAFPMGQAATRPLVPPLAVQRAYSATVWRSGGLTRPGTGSEACVRRSDQSAYPSQARATPTGIATFG